MFKKLYKKKCFLIFLEQKKSRPAKELYKKRSIAKRNVLKEETILKIKKRIRLIILRIFSSLIEISFFWTGLLG